MKLSNRSLSIIATAASVAAIVIPVVLYLLQVPNKSMTCFLISEARILNVDELGLPDITMTYKGESISRLDAATIEIKNSGNTPITRQDFDRDAYIIFGQGARVIRTEVTNQSPDNLRPTIEVQDNRILMKPILLNPGDSFSVESLVRGKYEAPTVDMRIRGITDIELMSIQHDPSKRRRLVFLSVTGLILLGIYGYASGLINPSILLKSQYIRFRDLAGGLTIVLVSAPGFVMCVFLIIEEANLGGSYRIVYILLGAFFYLLVFYYRGFRRCMKIRGLTELYNKEKVKKEAQQEYALDDTKEAPSPRE